jgi:hypothetical protein
MPLYPPKVGANGTVKQLTKAKLTEDMTSTSNAFVDLLTKTITTAGGTNLIIWLSCSYSVSNYYERSAMFNLVIDGYEVSRGGDETYQAANSGAIVYRAANLSAGSHTIKTQWRLNLAGDGTLRCRPVTVPENEGAEMLLMEVSV